MNISLHVSLNKDGRVLVHRTFVTSAQTQNIREREEVSCLWDLRQCRTSSLSDFLRQKCLAPRHSSKEPQHHR